MEGEGLGDSPAVSMRSLCGVYAGYRRHKEGRGGEERLSCGPEVGVRWYRGGKERCSCGVKLCMRHRGGAYEGTCGV